MKLVHLVGFIVKKFVTMHGHMNVKEGTPAVTSQSEQIGSSVKEPRAILNRNCCSILPLRTVEIPLAALLLSSEIKLVLEKHLFRSITPFMAFVVTIRTSHLIDILCLRP